MYLEKIKIKNFRNFESETICFSPTINILYGTNGQGKSSILEAIYFLATARSFRAARSKLLIKHQQEGFFIDALVNINEEIEEVRIYYSAEKKKIVLNKQKEDNFLKLIGRIQIVALTIEDIYLIKGDAGKRRRFLDIQASLVSELYLKYLRQYNQVLKNRNKLFKKNKINYSDLEIWTNKLIDLGTWIIKYRYKWIGKINFYAVESYDKIAKPQEKLKIWYKSVGENEIKQKYQQKMKENFKRDILYKTTHVGPHRDDIEIELNGKKAKDFASEGQQRSIVLALKMGEYKLMKEVKGDNPIMLIDDILNEIDDERLGLFYPLLHEGQQVIMTTTKKEETLRFKDSFVYQITNGKIE